MMGRMSLEAILANVDWGGGPCAWRHDMYTVWGGGTKVHGLGGGIKDWGGVLTCMDWGLGINVNGLGKGD